MTKYYLKSNYLHKIDTVKEHKIGSIVSIQFVLPVRNFINRKFSYNSNALCSTVQSVAGSKTIYYFVLGSGSETRSQGVTAVLYPCVWRSVGVFPQKNGLSCREYDVWYLSIAGCSNLFNRSMITIIPLQYVLLILSNRLIVHFYWMDYTTPWLEWSILVQILCLKPIDKFTQG